MQLQRETLYGAIISDAVLTAKVISSGSLIGTLSAPVIKYDSKYIATPKTTEQVLKTEDRYMKDDVIIKAIPFYKVDNTQNGQTVCIGDETYGY